MKTFMKNNKGFTLLELIIYIMLVAAISSVFTVFIRDVIRGSERSMAMRAVYTNERFIMAKIEQQVKTAKQIVSAAADELVLLNIENEIVAFYYDPAMKSLYFRNGAGDGKLSGDEVDIEEFVFSLLDGVVGMDMLIVGKRIDMVTNNKYEVRTSSSAVQRTSLY